MRLPLSLRLAAAFLRARLVRSVLASLAIVAATCVVLWVVSGYEALLASHDEFASRALGRYALSVDPISRALDREVPPAVVDALRADPQVTAADPMWAERITVKTNGRPQGVGWGGGTMHGRGGPGGAGGSSGRRGMRGLMPNEVMLLATDAPEPPFDMLRGSWLGGDAGAREAKDSQGEAIPVCLSAQVAKRLGLDVGGTFQVGRADDAPTLHVVGIVDNPPETVTGIRVGSMALPSPSIAGAYVTMQDAERIHKRPRRITFVGLSLAPGVDVHAFRFAWGPRLAEGPNPQQFQEDHDLEEALDEAEVARNVALQAYAATGVSMLLALLMVFNTLSMGVTERIRQLALLRAVALTRRQVATVIVIEGLALAVVGFIGGLLLGAGALHVVSSLAGGILRHGATIGRPSLLLAAVSSFGGALLASILPALRATRVRPLDAVAPRADAARAAGRATPWLALVALLLIAADPLLSFVLAPDFGGRVIPFMALGFVSLAAGILLLTPALVVLVDRFLAPPLARVLALSPRLLRQQMSSHLWRSVGAAIALTIGLGLFLAIQTWGFTMLSAFIPGPWAPDATIAFGSDGATAEQVAAIARLGGVDPDRCLPVVCEQPRMLKDLTGSADRASIIRQDNITIIGLDPRRALCGPSPLMEFEWVTGTPETAAASMAEGHACVVPDHFLRETGLSVGDSFAVVPPEDAAHPRSYTIAGAVRLPGWHWLTKESGLRTRTHRTASLVFADHASVAADFSLKSPSHLWLRYSPRPVSPRTLELKVQRLVAGDTPVRGEEMSEETRVRVVATDDTRRRVLASAARWIWAASVPPLVVVLIACLGLLNLILAAVRARYWELGVLRSIGFTRWTIVRLIVAEGLLVGAVACLLGLIFGLVAGWCGTGAASRMSFFGGLRPDLVVPVGGIVTGWLLLLVFTALAAAWPAVGAGRKRPLDLLQDGASAF